MCVNTMPRAHYVSNDFSVVIIAANPSRKGYKTVSKLSGVQQRERLQFTMPCILVHRVRSSEEI